MEPSVGVEAHGGGAPLEVIVEAELAKEVEGRVVGFADEVVEAFDGIAIEVKWAAMPPGSGAASTRSTWWPSRRACQAAARPMTPGARTKTFAISRKEETSNVRACAKTIVGTRQAGTVQRRRARLQLSEKKGAGGRSRNLTGQRGSRKKNLLVRRRSDQFLTLGLL